jgi:nicotinate-nucleotide adenylyltransferase
MSSWGWLPIFSSLTNTIFMKIDFGKPTVLYGGSFDPVHDGHLHVIRAVKAALPGHQLVVVPARQSPGKHAPIAPAELRLRWLELLAPAEGFLIWGTELHRTGPSYTVDTLEEAHSLGARKASLVLLMGADSYNNLPQWKDPERIRALARIAVLERPGAPLKAAGEDLLVSVPLHPASSTAIRASLGQNPPSWEYLPEAVKADLQNLTLLSQNPYARKR